MMKEIWLLTKTLLKANLGFSKAVREIKNDPRKLGIPLLMVLALGSLIPVYVLYIKLLKSVYLQLFVLQQEGTIFAILFSGASIAVLFFGMVYAMSTLYFSRDLERLLYLPLREESLIAAKFFNMVFYEYFIVLPFLLPVFFVAFPDLGGPMYALYFVVGVLLVPVIPLSLGTLLVMFIMKFVSLDGKKDMIRTVSLFAILILILGIQVLVSRAAMTLPPGSEAEFLAALLRDENSLVHLVGRSYPPAIWISKALYLKNFGEGLLYFILYGVVSAAFLLGTIQVGKRWYVQGFFNKVESSKKQGKAEDQKKLIQHSVWKAVFLQDFRLVMRTPVYLFNCVSIVVLLPVLLFLMPVLSGETELGFLLNIPPRFEPYVGLVLIGFFVFMAGINPTQSTTISREGKNYWVQQVLPISKRDRFIGRMAFPLVLQLFSMIFLLVGLAFVMKLRLSIMIGALAGGGFITLPILALGILVDTLRPKLDWDDPQKAVKQNFNVFIDMLLGAGYGVLIGFLSYQAIVRWEVKAGVLLLVWSLIGCLLTWVLYKLYGKVDERK